MQDVPGYIDRLGKTIIVFPDRDRFSPGLSSVDLKDRLYQVLEKPAEIKRGIYIAVHCWPTEGAATCAGCRSRTEGKLTSPEGVRGAKSPRFGPPHPLTYRAVPERKASSETEVHYRHWITHLRDAHARRVADGIEAIASIIDISEAQLTNEIAAPALDGIIAE